MEIILENRQLAKGKPDLYDKAERVVSKQGQLQSPFHL